MKIKSVFLVAFLFCLNLAAQEASVDFSKPEAVAQRFLELYFQGKWFDACKVLACEGCDDQMSYMFKKMDDMGTEMDETKCQFTIEKFDLDKSGNTGKVVYTKTCPGKKPVKNQIVVKKVGEKWLVDYVYRRDKFL